MSEDDRDDPFADLDTGEDREGDPFEQLTDDEESSTESTDETAPDLDDVFGGSESTPNEDVADVFEEPGEGDDTGFEQAGADGTADAGSGGGDGADRSRPESTSDTTADTSGPAVDDPFEDPAQFDRDASADASTSERAGTQPGTGPTEQPPTGDSDPDDPFAGMEDREGDPFEGGESAFERVDVGSVDADSVWEEITADEDDGPAGASVAEVPDVGYAEVSKHRYCEQCEFFSGPPEVACSHEEARILEFVDMETVRLADCPVVAEQRALENEE